MEHLKRISLLISAIVLIAACGGGGGGGGGKKGKKANPTDYVTLNSVVTINNTTIKAIFDEGITQTTAEDIANYSINGLTVSSAVRDLSNSTIVTLATSPQTNGASYTLTVSDIVGNDSSTLDTSNNTASFTGIAPVDNIGPSILAIYALDSGTIEVVFDEPVNDASVSAAKFTFNNGLTATNAERKLTNSSIVTVYTTQQAALTYTLTVDNSATGVLDLVGNSLSNNSYQFFGAGDANAPTLDLALQQSNTSIYLLFSETLDTLSAETETNYVISNCTTGTFTVTGASLLSSNAVTLTVTNGGVGDGTCLVTATNVKDVAGNAIIPGTNSQNFATTASDGTKPMVLQAQAINNSTVRVTFSEAVDNLTAIDAANYSFDNSLEADSVAQFGATNSYDVTLKPATPMQDLNYTVSVTGVYDIFNPPTANVIDPLNNAASFQGDVPPSVSSIIVIDATTILIVFSEVMNSPGDASNYDITDSVGDPVAHSSTAPVIVNDINSNPTNVVKITLDASSDGTDYTIAVNNTNTLLKDTNLNLLDTTTPFSATITTDASPVASAATALSGTSIEVTFNESVSATTAELVANYNNVIDCTGAGGGTINISSVNLTSAITAVLTIPDTPAEDGRDCVVRVQDVADLNTNLVSPNPTDLTFTYTAGDSTGPEVASATSYADAGTTKYFVRVTFNEPVKAVSALDANDALNPANYSFSGGLTVAAVTQVGGTGRIFDVETSAQDLVSYTLTVSNVADASAGNNPITTNNTAVFTGIYLDILAPAVFTAATVDNITVDVTFDESVELTSAQAPGFYRIDEGASQDVLTVISAVRQADPAVVRLTISSMTLDTVYTVVVTGAVKDLAGNSVDGAANFANFTGVADASPPMILGIYQYDCDSNGNMDEIVLRFSEPLDEGAGSSDTVDLAAFSRMTMAGNTIIGIDIVSDPTNGTDFTATDETWDGCSQGVADSEKDPGVANDNYVTVIADNTTIKGSDKKAMTYVDDPADSVKDLTGNVLPTFSLTAASTLIDDEAAPVIWSATTETGTNLLRVTFSEGVSSSADNSYSSFVSGDFVYCDDDDADPATGGCTTSGNVTALTGTLTDADGSDSTITIQVDANYDAADLFKDTIRVLAASVYDVPNDSDQNINEALDSLITPVAGIIRPYVLTVTQTGESTLRVTFSESMDTGVSPSPLDTTSFCVSTDATPPGSPGAFDIDSCANNLIIKSPVILDNSRTYDLTIDTVSTPINTVLYYVHTDESMQDVNDGRPLVAPLFSTFTGSEPPKVLGAEATSKSTILVSFSKPMTNGNPAACNSAENIANYGLVCSFDFQAGDGSILSAQLQSDPSKVLITHDGEQGVGYCTIIANNGNNTYADGSTPINASCTGGNGITDSVTGVTLADNPNDRASFAGAGGEVLSISQGALFTDPFADGTTFSFAFKYNDKIYLGPNDTNTGAFRFEADGANATSMTFGLPDLCVNPGYVAPCAFGFGNSTTADQGPEGADGIASFTSITVQGKEVLVVGPLDSNGTVTSMYWTTDLDTVLDVNQCGLPNPNPSGVQSIESIASHQNYVWMGEVSSQGAQKPVFKAVTLDYDVPTSSFTGACTDAYGASFKGNNIAHMKAADHFYLGIDTIFGWTAPNTTNYLFIANSSGIGRSTTALDGILTVNSDATVTDDAAGDGFIDMTPSTVGTVNWHNETLRVASMAKLRPGEKGVPFILEYDPDGAGPTPKKLYMARNKATYTDLTTDVIPDTILTPELWVCNNNCLLASDWTLVFDADSLTVGDAPESIGMLTIVGDRLYIGIDSSVDRARVFYYDGTDNSGAHPTDGSGFVEEGRVIPDPVCSGGFDSGGGLGGYCQGLYFFSHSVISKAGKDYLYITVGDGAQAVRVMRNVLDQ